MKKLTQFFLLLALILGFTSQTQAAVLIEPVLGYSIGSKLDIDEIDDYSGGMGLSYGARLGYQNLGFQLGLDYLKSSIDMDDNDFDENVDTSEWAAFVGFEFPVLLRVYAGYIFSATGESEMGGTNVDFKKGSGVKFGVGFTGLPFVDLNLEMRRGTYDEVKFSGIPGDTTADFQSYMLSVSLPFTI